MRGVLKDCFEISGRGVVLLLDPEEGSCLVGDWVKVGDKAWRISGIEMPNWKTLPPPHILKLKGVSLAGAAKADIAPLIGQPFETLKQEP